MRRNIGKGWEDMGPASGRPYTPIVSISDLPSQAPKAAGSLNEREPLQLVVNGCVVCGNPLTGRGVRCPTHTILWNAA